MIHELREIRLGTPLRSYPNSSFVPVDWPIDGQRKEHALLTLFDLIDESSGRLTVPAQEAWWIRIERWIEETPRGSSRCRARRSRSEAAAVAVDDLGDRGRAL